MNTDMWALWYIPINRGDVNKIPLENNLKWFHHLNIDVISIYIDIRNNTDAYIKQL